MQGGGPLPEFDIRLEADGLHVALKGLAAAPDAFFPGGQDPEVTAEKSPWPKIPLQAGGHLYAFSFGVHMEMILVEHDGMPPHPHPKPDSKPYFCAFGLHCNGKARTLAYASIEKMPHVPPEVIFHPLASKLLVFDWGLCAVFKTAVDLGKRPEITA